MNILAHAKRPFVLIPAILLFLFLAAFLFQVAFLPGLVRGKILDALEKKGLGSANVKVTSVSYFSAVLENLDLDKQFKIKKIRIRYSLRSLWRGEIIAIRIRGAEINVAYRDRTWDFGPLQSLMEKQGNSGPANLPFNKLILKKSLLRLWLEGRSMTFPLDGVFRKTGNHTIAVELQTRIDDAASWVRGAMDLDKKTLEGAFKITELDLASLRFAAPFYPPVEKLPLQGRVDLSGNISYGKEWMTGALSIAGRKLLFERPTQGPGLRLPVNGLTAELKMDSFWNVALDLSAALDKAPIRITAAFNADTRAGKCECRMDQIDGPVLKTVQENFLPRQKISIQGTLKADARVLLTHDTGSVEIGLTGDRFQIRAGAGANSFTVAPASVQAKASFTMDSNGVTLIRSRVSANLEHLASDSLGLAADNIVLSMPFDWRNRKITEGTVAVGSLNFNGLSCSTITATCRLDKSGMKVSATGAFGPWAKIAATGTFGPIGQGLAGDIVARIPTFTTQNKRWLANLIPPLRGDEASGTLSAEARLTFGNGPLLQSYVFYLQDAAYGKSRTDLGVQGVSCTLRVRSFVPFLTDGNQHVLFREAHTGSFRVENGNVDFCFADTGRMTVPSLETGWAKGKLSVKNMRMDFTQSRLSLDVNADTLDLQAILDFMKYKGVAGDGRISGHVPVTLNWGRRARLSFGDGFLEARPPVGGLRFSREMAMKLLGVKKDIPPKTKDQQEIVMLMMLRALQDMEYTGLRMVLQNDEHRVLKTRVETQGYGPRGQRENRIPIGGLKINISSLDDLLNQIILPNVRTLE